MWRRPSRCSTSTARRPMRRTSTYTSALPPRCCPSAASRERDTALAFCANSRPFSTAWSMQWRRTERADRSRRESLSGCCSSLTSRRCVQSAARRTSSFRFGARYPLPCCDIRTRFPPTRPSTRPALPQRHATGRTLHLCFSIATLTSARPSRKARSKCLKIPTLCRRTFRLRCRSQSTSACRRPSGRRCANGCLPSQWTSRSTRRCPASPATDAALECTRPRSCVTTARRDTSRALSLDIPCCARGCSASRAIARQTRTTGTSSSCPSACARGATTRRARRLPSSRLRATQTHANHAQTHTPQSTVMDTLLLTVIHPNVRRHAGGHNHTASYTMRCVNA
eukprot:Opistho-2@34027